MVGLCISIVRTSFLDTDISLVDSKLALNNVFTATGSVGAELALDTVRVSWYGHWVCGYLFALGTCFLTRTLALWVLNLLLISVS